MSFRVSPTADLDEFTQAVLAIGQYFGMEPTRERMERFSRNLPLERMHAARADGRIVGGAGSFPVELTVPGGTVRAAGVTVVGTYPTHRRRGVLRALMRAQLDDLHARGEPVAVLWASEETIYGRYGYGMASLVGEMSLPREHAAFALPFEPDGTLRLVEAEEALRAFPQVWNAVRRSIPGMLARSRTWWETRVLHDPPEWRAGAGPKRFVLLERRGRPAGYAIYRHKPKREDGVSDSELQVLEAIALEGSPTAAIWRYLLDIDWAARITAHLLPLDHPSSTSWPPRGACACGSGTASGRGSWTSAPRSPPAGTRRRARSSWRSQTPSAPGTRAAGASPGAPRGAPAPSRTCAAT
ncbi:MAG TPA: GNAT family N-acetyltransferase [Gaiellaceae bacterium]|nr:GNAT family N-acetyltransferase [Gaiellaceae bacterium]